MSLITNIEDINKSRVDLLSTIRSGYQGFADDLFPGNLGLTEISGNINKININSNNIILGGYCISNDRDIVPGALDYDGELTTTSIQYKLQFPGKIKYWLFSKSVSGGKGNPNSAKTTTAASFKLSRDNNIIMSDFLKGAGRSGAYNAWHTAKIGPQECSAAIDVLPNDTIDLSAQVQWNHDADGRFGAEVVLWGAVWWNYISID